MQTSRNSDIARQRAQAKLGLTVSLGVLVASGLASRMDGPWTQGARTLHVCAGVALVGFSYWHLTLYQQPVRMRGRSA